MLIIDTNISCEIVYNVVFYISLNHTKKHVVKIKFLLSLLFADNTASLADGLHLGEMYRTPSNALMIVY